MPALDISVECSIQENRQRSNHVAPTAELCREDLTPCVKSKTVSLRNLKVSTDSTNSALRVPRSRAFFLILLAGFCFSLCLHFSHLRFWNDAANYEGDNIPLMSTYDAYYYLKLTEQTLSHENTGRAVFAGHYQRHQSLPLLVSITALIHRATKLPIELIAFCLPPILGSLMVIIYTCWGYAISGPMTAFISSLAGLSSFYWYNRTCLGRFDTDCLNPFFFFGILFLVYRFVISKGRVRIVYLALSFMLAFIFNLWWPQVPYFGFFLVLFSYCLSVLLPSSKWEKAVKIGLIFLTGFIVLCALVDFRGILPQWLDNFIRAYEGQLGLIGNKAGLASTFPSVGASISELQPLPMQRIIEEVGGHLITFVMALIGLFFLLKDRKDAACFLIVGLVFALLSAFARRFLIFFIPLYALGVGYFVGELCYRSRLLGKIPSTSIKWSLVLFVSAALLFPGMSRSFSRNRGPSLTKGDLELAEAIKKRGNVKDVIWAWWDYGYFLSYLTGIPTFIDGGSQTGERTYIAAFPLSCNNPVLARNWMRFFAVRDLAGLYRVQARLNKDVDAINFLQDILAHPASADKILKRYGIQDTKGWKEYLFPDVRVWLFLNRDFINKIYWWYYFGTWDHEKGKGFHPMVWMGEGNTQSLLKTGEMKFGDRSVNVDTILDVGLNGEILQIPTNRVDPGEANSSQPQQPTSSEARKGIGSIAVAFQKYNLIYFLDSQAAQSLAVRLSFLSPFGVPGYIPVAYDPRAGGVWMVE